MWAWRWPGAQRRGERGDGARAEVERRPREPALRKRVEHEHDIGVALLVILRHVKGCEAQRGAPVHVPNAIARHERSDLGRLETFAGRPRDVLPGKGLRAERRRHVTERDGPWIDTHGLGIPILSLECAEPGAVPDPRSRSVTGPSADLRSGVAGEKSQDLAAINEAAETAMFVHHDQALHLVLHHQPHGVDQRILGAHGDQ